MVPKRLYPIHCHRCDKGFDTQAELDKHETNRLRFCNADIKCKRCNLTLWSKKKLVEHKCGPTFCDECQKEYHDPVKFKRHNKRVHSKKPVLCTICGKGFQTVSNLNKHKRRLHRQSNIAAGKIKCESCGMVVFKTYLEGHMTLYHSGNAVKCKVCNKPLCNKDGLNHHMLKVHGNASKVNKNQPLWDLPQFSGVSCDICGFYLNTEGLTSHKEQHTIEQELRCSRCDLSFSTQEQLFNHTYRFCKNLDKCFTCPLCSNFLTMRWIEAVNHLTTCGGSSNGLADCYYCHYCYEVLFPVEFSDHVQQHILSDCRFHSQLHVNCNKCPLKFPTMESATLHKKICTAGNQAATPDVHPCSRCKAIAKTDELMSLHNKTAHGVDLPGYKAGSNSKPRSNQILFDGSLPNYVCYLCGLRMFDRITMRIHIELCGNKN